MFSPIKRHTCRALIFAGMAAVTGCQWDDGLPPQVAEVGRIELVQSGGFAGVLRTLTLEVVGQNIYLTRLATIPATPATATEVTLAAVRALWKTLEANDAFSLPSDTTLQDHVSDGFVYALALTRGSQRHSWTVYAPEILAQETGEARYANVVSAIQALPAVGEIFEVSTLPVNAAAVEIATGVAPVAVVRATLGDGCTTVFQQTQHRQGALVRVEITTKRPQDAPCTLNAQDIELRLPLEGAFSPGDYRLEVNGAVVAFSV